MDSFTFYILTAFAMVFVIEGLFYALFPDTVKRMMMVALAMPSGKLRSFGFVMVGFGFLFVWLLQQMA